MEPHGLVVAAASTSTTGWVIGYTIGIIVVLVVVALVVPILMLARSIGNVILLVVVLPVVISCSTASSLRWSESGRRPTTFWPAGSPSSAN